MLIYAADDEKLPLELLEDAIMEAIPGATPECFRTAESLLKRIEEMPPDVVFLDINMPGMNGIDIAKEINRTTPGTIIIFVTGHSEFANEAFDVFASGYIMKPCRAESIEKIMNKLNISEKPAKEIYIQTFGNFDVFYKGQPVYFRSPKSKEMLAYLVDRSGALISRQEMASVIFEDDFSRSVQVRLSKFALRLFEDLESAGLKDFFFIENGYRIDLSKAECDVIEYLKGSDRYTFIGEYMEQYSWGEYRKGNF